MSLSKKHFEKVAEILRTCNSDKERITAFEQWFSMENLRFDSEKFKRACQRRSLDEPERTLKATLVNSIEGVN